MEQWLNTHTLSLFNVIILEQNKPNLISNLNHNCVQKQSTSIFLLPARVYFFFFSISI